MSKKRFSCLDESRWRSALAALAAAVVLPGAAQASPKFENAKHLLTDAARCGRAAAPSASATPSEIILGGAPSALDRIRASQRGGAPDAATVQAAPVLTMAGLVLPPRMTFEPAGRTPIVFAPPPPSAETVDCAAQVPFSKARPESGLPDFIGRTKAADPAAELGTRAIPVKRTRFDDRWNRVRRAPSAAAMRTQLVRARVSAGLGERELLEHVNQWVNRQIAYVNDDRNYGSRDVWATAEQTIARGKGDCEDFAILKMHMLRAAGIDPDRMKLVLLRDLAANSDHAFLLVQTDRGKYVLDNTTDRIYDGSQSNSVRPVLSFSGNRRWVHAYRGTEPSPDLVAQPASAKSFAVAINNQRSVSADPLTFKTGLSR